MDNWDERARLARVAKRQHRLSAFLAQGFARSALASNLLVSRSGDVIGEKTFRKLKQFDLRGYKRVSTYKNGKGVNLAVHRLVLATFAPITGWEQMQVNHVDGNRGNNRIENLRWCTHDENAKHTLARGTQARGGNHGKSVFSDREATKLINYYRKHRPNNKFTLSEMARKFGVNRNTLKGLLFGRNWSHLKARADWLEARKP